MPLLTMVGQTFLSAIESRADRNVFPTEHAVTDLALKKNNMRSCS